jgi:hypothetical protein
LGGTLRELEHVSGSSVFRHLLSDLYRQVSFWVYLALESLKKRLRSW